MKRSKKAPPLTWKQIAKDGFPEQSSAWHEANAEHQRLLDEIRGLERVLTRLQELATEARRRDHSLWNPKAFGRRLKREGRQYISSDLVASLARQRLSLAFQRAAEASR